MTEAATTRPDNDPLSRFLASFPTKLGCSKTEYFVNRRVFWTQEAEIESSSSSDVSEVHEKIKSAFGDIFLDPLKGVLQFWAPLKTSCGRLILSTSNQPFSFAYLNSLRHKYRLSSLSYHSTIIDDYTESKENPMIITGPPATAFLNRFPVVLDLSVHQDDPLVRSALECGLTCSLLLPVFIHPSQTASSCCVGVVECSVKRSGLVIFNQLKTALERVGLSIYHVQESRPYKSIPGLKCATNEIEEALEIVCESHGLTLAQVWIPFENENDIPSSSSSAEKTRMKQKLVVKLIGYRDVSDDHRTLVIDNYYDTCDMLPLRFGEGLAGKTLQNYEPLFCQNLKELSDNGLLGLLSANTKCSCFAICLRSVDTGDLDYAFEFLWPRNRNCIVILKSLLSTLKRCLPSFKFASGTELGDELRVAVYENSIETGSGFSKTLKRNRLSHWKKSRNVLGVSELQGPKFLKRKFSNFSGSASDREDNTANQEPSVNINQTAYLDEEDDDKDDDDVFIFASYREEVTLFRLSYSSTLAAVMEEIDEEFNLDPEIYKLEFKFGDGKWAKLNNDADFKSCLEVCMSAERSRMTVRVLQLPYQNVDMQVNSWLGSSVIES